MKRLVVAVVLGASLVAAAPASAQDGYAEWERCQQNAYYQLNFFDPTSAGAYATASLACARALGADLSNLHHIVAWQVCLVTEFRRGLKDPVGYMPLVLTSEAWRCNAEYLGEDIEIPPDAQRLRETRSQRLTRSWRSTRALSRPAPQSTRSRRPSRASR